MRLIGSKSAYVLFLALALLLNSSPPVPLHAVGQREFMFGFDGTATEAKRLSEAATLQRLAVMWIGFPEILLVVSIGIYLVIFRRARKPRRGKQN